MPVKFTLKFSGMSDSSLFGDVVEIVVDTNVYLPGMFTILIEDKQAVPGLPALMYTDNMLKFKIGTSVEIGVEKSAIPYSPITKKNTLIKVGAFIFFLGEPSCRITSLNISPFNVLRTHFTETAPISNPS